MRALGSTIIAFKIGHLGRVDKHSMGRPFGTVWMRQILAAEHVNLKHARPSVDRYAYGMWCIESQEGIA